MTGLEKMKSQILEEAEASAAEQIREAEGRAEEILAAAKEEADRYIDSISRRAASDAANYKERIASSIDLQRRTGLLAAKQEVIAEVLEKAYQAVSGMGTEEYFALIEKMLKKHALPQEGRICFSDRDLKRMPAGFEERIKKAAREKGGELTLEGEGGNIEDGFVLIYGGIEENCTLKAVFDSRKDELSDRIHELLFL